ncbi:MAG: glycosyltransferase family 4 protein [Thermoplasmata archaeon]
MESPPLAAVRPLHVVMVGWEYPPHHSGGLGVHCFELCRELGRMGHRITFLTPFHGPFTETPGVEFRWPGGPADADLPYPDAYTTTSGPSEGFSLSMDSYNAWIGGLTDLSTVDVIHVHDWFGTVGAASLAHRLDRPLVMTMHSTEFDRTLGHPDPDILERERWGLASADRVIAVSRHLKDQLIHRYDVPAQRIQVVYNAVRPTDRLERLKNAGPMVLYLGRLAAMKGVDTFLRAAQRVANDVPEAVFVVAGEGPEFPHLVTLAVHLGISDRVMFVGKVTEEERSLLLAGASVFVLPSVVEPFGIAALEAMAAGVPTIVSKTSGVAEITPTSFAVDFWDSDEFASRILELLRYPELRELMGAHSRWEALRTGWPERALETVGVYAQLLEARRGSR